MWGIRLERWMEMEGEVGGKQMRQEVRDRQRQKGRGI